MWASLNDVKLGHNVVYYNFILCADIEYIYKKNTYKAGTTRVEMWGEGIAVHSNLDNVTLVHRTP